jgi:hypothetical protein
MQNLVLTLAFFGLQRLAFAQGEVLAGLIFLGLFFVFGVTWHNKVRGRI